MTTRNNIIQIQVGQAGNRIGQAFWNNLIQEHGIDKDGFPLPNSTWEQQFSRSVFFNELSSGKCVPRSIFTDLDGKSIDEITGSRYGRLFDPDNYVYDDVVNGSQNNWACGHYSEGYELIDEVMDSIRRETERCDTLHGFQFVHALAGGTGSGFGTLIVSRLREDRMMINYVLVPSPKATEVVTETYNTLLAFHQLIENSDNVTCFDNEALFNACSNQLQIQEAQYEDSNSLMAVAMSNVTASCRFPGSQLNMDYRKLCVGLVPFPRLHFFTASLSPLQSANSHRIYSVPDIIKETLENKTVLASVERRADGFLTATACLRGNVSQFEVETSLRKFRTENETKWGWWLGMWSNYTTCPVTPPGYPVLGTVLANSVSINTIFRSNLDQFSRFFRRKAYLHHYTGFGMDEMEFAEAESNVADLTSEYGYHGYYYGEDEYVDVDDELVV